MTVTIYHNPRCTKSRLTLQLLHDRSLELTVIEYLKTPPSAEELVEILKKLKLGARDILRTGEEAYGLHNLGDETKSDETLIAAMVKTPILIERPIVVVGDRAAIGRPPENILEIL